MQEVQTGRGEKERISYHYKEYKVMGVGPADNPKDISEQTDKPFTI